MKNFNKTYHAATLNGHTFRLVYLPGGVFEMGDEENISTFSSNVPIHKVELSPFYMAEFPTTQALWKAVMGNENNPSRFKGDHRPVEQVSWIDIVEGNQDNEGQPAFLTLLNQMTKDNRPAQMVYRLPTEAEWEYAARANTNCLYAGGDKLKKVGWYNKNSHSETKEVGLLEPNNFGLYDMSGNVWEWCLDWESGDFYQKCFDQGLVKDPLNNQKGLNRVYRGGAWFLDARRCRLAFRDHGNPTHRFILGFRLVLAPRISGAEKEKRTE